MFWVTSWQEMTCATSGAGSQITGCVKHPTNISNIKILAHIWSCIQSRDWYQSGYSEQEGLR